MNTFQGDNYRFDITATGDDLLRIAIQVAFMKENEVVDIKEVNNTLVLYWSTEKANPFMTLDFEATFKVVKEWLDKQTQYPNEPNHDGDNKKGFRVYNEAWGEVKNDWRAFCGIEPVRMMYGK